MRQFGSWAIPVGSERHATSVTTEHIYDFAAGRNGR